MDKYQRFVEQVMAVYKNEVANRREAATGKPMVEAVTFGYLHGMIIGLCEELKQHKEETAALKERVERLEARLNQ